jgi:3-dehydroquinate synthase
VEYEIKSSPDLFSIDNKDLLKCISKRVLIVIDEKVRQLYSNKIINYLRNNGIAYHIVSVNGEEPEKNAVNLFKILVEMEQFGIERRSNSVIGIGGGVVLDVLGLAASLYRRGIPFIRIPTTLLGIVDVSVSAKSGINFENRRNRLGSYYPPIVCFLDKTFLPTVSSAEISSGMGEILKMSIVKDYELFQIVEKHGKSLLDSKFNCQFSDEVINRSISGMVEELKDNLWEKDLKRLVDFGHSFSPIIEMRSWIDKDTIPLLHGQAVMLDVIFSSIISYERGLLPWTDLERIINVTRTVGLPVYHTSFTNDLLLIESLQDTIKHRNGSQNLPIPLAIGRSVFVNDVTGEEIQKCANKVKYCLLTGELI